MVVVHRDIDNHSIEIQRLSLVPEAFQVDTYKRARYKGGLTFVLSLFSAVPTSPLMLIAATKALLRAQGVEPTTPFCLSRSD